MLYPLSQKSKKKKMHQIKILLILFLLFSGLNLKKTSKVESDDTDQPTVKHSPKSKIIQLAENTAEKINLKAS